MVRVDQFFLKNLVHTCKFWSGGYFLVKEQQKYTYNSLRSYRIMCNLVCNELENGGSLHVVGEDEAENNDDEFNTQPSLFLPRQQRIPQWC